MLEFCSELRTDRHRLLFCLPVLLYKFKIFQQIAPVQTLMSLFYIQNTQFVQICLNFMKNI